MESSDEAYLQRHVKSGESLNIDSKYISRNPAAALILKDGTKVSVQASRNNYSTPRNDNGPYTRFEVGDVDGTFNPPESWNEWADGPDSWVYGYVPFLELMMVIALHGGIDAEATERHTATVRASKHQR